MSGDIKNQLTRSFLEVTRANEYGEAVFVSPVGYFISDATERCLYQSCVSFEP
jgi:hypothetical protein